MVVFGSSLFGKVYAVRGVCHVATRFLHVFFVPLVPTSSWLVFDEPRASFFGTGGEGHQLKSIHWGSVAAAWIRSFLSVCAVAASIVGATVVLLDRASGDIVGAWALVALAIAGIWLSYRLTRATPDVVVRVLERSGVPPDLIARVGGAFQKS